MIKTKVIYNQINNVTLFYITKYTQTPILYITFCGNHDLTDMTDYQEVTQTL